MQQYVDPTRQAAQESYTGSRLTNAEFNDAYAISGIIARDIKKTGSFVEARENYAFAYSKGKSVTPDQAQGVLNDIFRARYGQSMNQMREELLAQDQAATVDAAQPYAQRVGPLIQEGDTMPFYKALDQASEAMANDRGITQKRAKALMKEADDGLYDMGKELEAAYHKPVAEAAKAERKVAALERKRSVKQSA